MAHRKPLIALVLLVLTVPGVAQIQLGCPTGDDGFAVGCCNTPQVNLPSFPAMQTGGKHGCLQGCTVEATHGVTINLGVPNFVVCDIALIPCTISPSSAGAPGWSGMLLAKYSRTFQLVDASGILRQTWRFIVNGDLVFDPASGAVAPCPVPACAAVLNNVVHWWGSIDYQCVLVSAPPFPPFASWRVRMELTHAPGCLQHAPWTTTPLSGPPAHDDRSFHVVAPASFTFAPVPAPQGAIVSEAVRSSTFSLSTGYACFGEAPVNPLAGALTNVMSDCLCGPLPPPVGLWTHQDLVGSTTCTGAIQPFSSVPLPGTPFPTGFVSLALGYYTGAGGAFNWPAGTELTVHWGILQYQDVCAGNFPFHVVHGVTTGGMISGTIFQPNPVTPGWFNSFTDLANNKGFSFTPQGALPQFGSLSWSDTVWNLNTL